MAGRFSDSTKASRTLTSPRKSSEKLRGSKSRKRAGTSAITVAGVTSPRSMRQRVGERLERRARRARGDRAVHLSRAARGVVGRPHQRAHRAGLHFDHDDGAAVHRAALQTAAAGCLPPGAASPASSVVRTSTPRGRGGHADEIAEVRRAERIGPGARLQRLRERLRPLARRDESRRLPCAPARRPAAALARSGCRSGRRREGDCGSPASNAASARLSCSAPFAEIAPRGSLDADDVAAERRAVQILRQDLAFAQAAAPSAARERPRSPWSAACAGAARSSGSPASRSSRPPTGGVRTTGSGLPRARSPGTSTPGCVQKRRSSAATMAFAIQWSGSGS